MNSVPPKFTGYRIEERPATSTVWTIPLKEGVVRYDHGRATGFYVSRVPGIKAEHLYKLLRDHGNVSPMIADWSPLWVEAVA